MVGPGLGEASDLEVRISHRETVPSGSASETSTMRVGNRLGPVTASGLREDVIYVRLDGDLAHEELLGDLRVGHAGSDELQHLGFAGGESIRKSTAHSVQRWKRDDVHQACLYRRVHDGLARGSSFEGAAYVVAASVLRQV